MRDEARQVVAAAMAAMADEMQAMGTPPTDRQARVQLYRDWQASGYHPVPEAKVREIGGVPCCGCSGPTAPPLPSTCTSTVAG